MSARPTEAPAALGTHAASDTPDAVTVLEARRVLLAGSRVAGGAAGLSRRVTWATTLRSRPPAFEPRGGGEFVLASSEALVSLRQFDSTLTVARILDGLSQAGAAALALPGPIPPDAGAAADALGLPLIEVPAGVSLLDVERGIIGLVLDRHNELQTRASQFYRHLAQLSVESEGLDVLIKGAADATGRIVVFEDALFRVRTAAAPSVASLPPIDSAGLSSAHERSQLADALRAQPLSSTTPIATRLPAARWRLERYVAPVVTRERLRGYVSLCGEPGSLTEFDQLAASRAAAICAIELAKEDAVLAAEQRVQGDVLDELLRPYADAETMSRRAIQVGLPATGLYSVVVLSVNDLSDRERAAALVDALSRQARRSAHPMLVRAGAAEVVVVCAVSTTDRASGAGGRNRHTRAGSHIARSDGDATGLTASTGATGTASGTGTPVEKMAIEAAERRLRAAAERLFVMATQEVGAGHVSAGVSRVCATLAALPAAAREAREALRIGRRVHGAGQLIAYGDLGLYRLLHALSGSPELQSFYEQTLGPLVEYDRRAGQNLIRPIETLEAFFACNGNISQTALRLQMHRNSLLYRLSRIQEVGGIDLEDPDTRLSLQVALKARRLLS